MDQTVANLLSTMIVTGAQRGADLNGIIDRNLTQGFGVTLETVVQAQASVSDDSGLIAALQTASRAPRQGANPVT